MPDVGFRYDRADLLKAVADRRGVGLSTLLRSLADSALASEGFPVTEQQYCLVRDGEFVQSPRGGDIRTYKPVADEQGDWWPIVNEDSEEYLTGLHWRLPPEHLHLDAERGVVVRLYKIVPKSMEHA